MNSKLFGSLLLLTSALVTPGAFAQEASSPQDAQPEAVASQVAEAPAKAEEAPVEVSGPGGRLEDIVVRGRFIPNTIKNNPVVVSVLSAEEIARTGDGDIAGALQRVTGLSVVGGKFVYVRGLGERYSLALLNGLPLPSPEPLRRVVPLDLFPTGILASSVVQKTYSANFPGEFGGGAINLTTKSLPEEPFLKFGVGFGGNSETTGELGYTYYGSDTDWTGFDSGTRDVPAALARANAQGNPLVVGANFSEAEVQAITATLQNASTNLIQRNNNIPVDVSFDLSGGTFFDAGDNRFGVIANFSYANSWQTRGGIQQETGGAQTNSDGELVLPVTRDFDYLSTRNRVVLNGLVGLSAEIGDHKLRWTNLYIRDTLKEASISAGLDTSIGDELVNISDTAWYERQLVDTQFVGEFDFGAVDLDIRAGYAESKRDAPYERQNSYVFSPEVGDFVNDLRSPGQRSAISFSNLDDKVLAGALDVGYELPTDRAVVVSAGYAYTKNDRNSIRRDYRYGSDDGIPIEVAQQRPDFLLSDFNVYNFGVVLTETTNTAGQAAYEADLEVHAGYGQVEAELLDGVSITAGVRYEDGQQSVTPISPFLNGGPFTTTQIDNSYWLPAATLTWNFYEDMQFRVAASKTIARPQFRELAPQQYNDPDIDRTFFGNEFLVDSELLNLDARYEWYFGQDERFSLAAFYKKIDKPIETVAFLQGEAVFSTFANAPEATLIGAELELQKYFPLYDFAQGSKFFESRRLYIGANYTFTDSEVKVGEGDTTVQAGSAGTPVAASAVFRDGSRLTGQSKHVANLQFGLEDEDSLSQQTLIINYASDRVTVRAPISDDAPDWIESPGVQLDFVVRQGFALLGADMEFKFEARNLLGERYEETQTLNSSQILINTYDRGRSFSVSLSAEF